MSAWAHIRVDLLMYWAALLGRVGLAWPRLAPWAIRGIEKVLKRAVVLSVGVRKAKWLGAVDDDLR